MLSALAGFLLLGEHVSLGFSFSCRMERQADTDRQLNPRSEATCETLMISYQTR